MNKADKANAIQTGLNAIRAVLGDLKPPFICPISAISGEYQFVRDGLFSVQRTKKYNSKREGREVIRKKYLKRRGHEPSEDYICQEIEDSLQDDYEHPYSFEDLDGNEYELTLAEWVKMMTTDYLARLRALKTLEMLHAGMYAEKQLVSSINMRITTLLMLNQGGGDMGRILAEQVKKLVNDKLDSVVEDIETDLEALNRDVAKELFRRKESLVSGYTDSIKKIEDNIARIIRTAADSLRKNAFGNCIINPTGFFFTQAGKNDARHNLQVLNNLIDNVKKIDVVGYLMQAGEVLKDILSDVSRQYTEVRDKSLKIIYSRLASQVEQKMNEAYAETRQKHEGSDNGISFDRFYKSLFEQLKDSIIKKMQGFAGMASKMIQGNTEVSDVISEVINYASTLLVQLQDCYNESEESYLKALRGITAAGNTNFNVTALKAQANIPFFAPEAAKQWADEAVTKLSDMAIDKIPDAFKKFTSDVSNLNQSGMLGTLDVIDDIINPNIQHGQTNVEAEIATLNGGLSEIRTRIDGMFKTIQTAVDVLRNCDWAASDVESLDTAHNDIINDSGR